MRTILAVDLGTTLIKAVLFDESGRIIKSTDQKYPLINISKNEIEQDPFLLWSIVKTLIKKLTTDPGVDVNEIRTIGFSSQGISIIPVDVSYKPLRNMISWLDSRAVREVCEIEKKFTAEDIFHITGKKLNEFYSLPKILWMRNNEPDVFKRIRKVLLPLDYIYYKLTGTAVTDHTMAGGTLLYDVENRVWSGKILRAFNIDPDILPVIEDAGGYRAPLTDKAAGELGLSRDVTVVLGAQDQKCAGVGAGIDEKTAVISMGTCSAILVECAAPVFDEQIRIPLFSFIKKNSYVLEAVISTTGIVFEWLRKLFFQNKSFDQLTSLAERANPGSHGVFFYPHFEGAGTPHLNQKVRGFLYGLSLAVERDDIIRSLLEGVAFQIRKNLEVIEEIRNVKIKKIKIIGGGAKSNLWCSIIADVLNREVVRFESSEVASIGAAIIAGAGTGIFKDLTDGYEKMRGGITEFKPGNRKAAIYDEIYRKYIDIEKKMIS